MTSISSVVNLPHFSRTLPLSCVHCPLSVSSFITILLRCCAARRHADNRSARLIDGSPQGPILHGRCRELVRRIGAPTTAKTASVARTLLAWLTEVTTG